MGTGQVAFKWRDLKLSETTHEIELAAASLTGPAEVNVTDLRYATGSDGQGKVSGKVSVKADIAKSLAAAAPFMGGDKPPAITGALDYNADISQQGKQIVIRSGGQINNFSFQSGDKTIRENALKLTQNAAIDLSAHKLTLEKSQVDSKLLSLSAKGTVDKLDGDKVIDISGSYKTSWDELIPLLRQLYPKEMEHVVITGDSASDFHAVGPIGEKGITPAWRDLKVTGFALHWISAEAYGLKIGAANLAPTISGGQISLPVTDMGANDGTLRLGGVFNMTGKDPIYDLSQKVQVMGKVNITPELKEALLTRINPIFSHVAQITGSVTLQSSDLNVPLSEAIKHQGTGHGHLDLSNLYVAPSGEFAGLLKLMGIGDPSAMRLVKMTSVDFQIHDGKISYQNLGMDLGVVDLVFSGSVGFDDSVEMTVSMPLSRELLVHIGVPPQLASAINGVRVPVPIIGTRTNFHFGLEKIDLAPLLKQATENVAKGLGGVEKMTEKGVGAAGQAVGGAVGGVGGLLGSHENPKQEPSSQPSKNQSPPPEKKPKSPLEGLFK